ncbi:MAG: tetratricopeptide repeat protein [Verrucomicrobiota bacterium JB023]|nr:tetratricopeptide repeat protein [Verrucomicrobiota bacterium JB023]
MRLLLPFLLALPLLADNSANLALFAKGVFAENKGDLPAARDLYAETLTQDPGAFPLASKLSRIQGFMGEHHAATATLRDFATANRRHLIAQLSYVSFLRQHAYHDALAQQAAVETLEIANENFPNQPSIYEPLINLYETLEQRSDSLAVLQDQFTAETDDPYHWLALAPIVKTLHPADSTEYREQLATIYKKASVRGLADAETARKISEYHRSQGDLPAAIHTIQNHLEQQPSSHSLRTRLGLLYLSNQQEEKGEKTLLDVIAIDPDQALAHQSLAKLYRRQQKPLPALHHRAELLRIQGGTPDQTIALANEYLELDQPHPARLLLEKARFDFPESPAIHARLAIATLRDGETKEAALLFRQAETLAESSQDPSAIQYLDADFQIEFAHSLVEAGDQEAAETRLRQAAQNLDIDQHPEKYARAVTSLAKIWLAEGRNEGPAKALLQRAISIDPENAEAHRLLEKN